MRKLDASGKIAGFVSATRKRMGGKLSSIPGKIKEGGGKVIDALGGGGKINHHGLVNPYNGRTARLRRNPEKQNEVPGFNRPDLKAVSATVKSNRGNPYGGFATLGSLITNVAAPIKYDSQQRRSRGQKVITRY